MEPLISVIIPLYNCENYIVETLESVINQSYKNLEILVVDDGSKDNSAQKVRELALKDCRIKYIYQNNAGVSMARNKAIEASTGEFLSFIDADDLWNPLKLEKQLNKIMTTKSDVCYSKFTRLNESTKSSLEPDMNLLEGKISFHELLNKNFPQTSTWLIKKSILAPNIVFTPKCNWGEDLEFFSKVLTLGKVCSVSEALSTYRLRESDSLTSNYNVNSMKSSLATWKRLRAWLKDNSHVAPLKVKEGIDFIDKVKIPEVLIELIWNCYKDKALKQECKTILREEENRKYLDNINFTFSKEGLKNWIKLFIAKNC